MQAKYINPFISAIESVLSMFGVTDVTRSGVSVKEDMALNNDVTAFVGIVGEIRGNVSYSYSYETAKAICSAMMMGMPVTELDDMARSALGEFANILTGNAASLLAQEQVNVDITPPSVVSGGDVDFILSTVRTLSVKMNTGIGTIEIDLGLEI